MIDLPLHIDRQTRQLPAETRRIVVLGQNGAGKSAFASRLAENCGNASFHLSALTAMLPAAQESIHPASIEAQYRSLTFQLPYIRTDAVSQLDMLSYMLLADELAAMMAMKRNLPDNASRIALQPTKLDILKKAWRKHFPDSTLEFNATGLASVAGHNKGQTSILRLSHGEKAILYYLAGILFAPAEAVVFIDNPALFLHPSVTKDFWSHFESMRPDCITVYSTADPELASTLPDTTCIWVKSYRHAEGLWDYELLSPQSIAQHDFMALAGTRRPVLFVEGDDTHSLDMKLYSLVFKSFTVRPLGSCNKVIEATRSFNDLKPLHHLDSRGIVDRDRRTPQEVKYLRQKRVMVPEVAEIENIFLLPDVIKTLARLRGRDPEKVFGNVTREVMRQWRDHLGAQALMHVRHRVKHHVEHIIDARFSCITALETHLRSLPGILKPRNQFDQLLGEFKSMAKRGDYEAVLRVFNHKPMLASCGVAESLGFCNKDQYVDAVLSALSSDSREAENLRKAVIKCFLPGVSD